MREYLARNLKAEVLFFSPNKLVTLRKVAPSRNVVYRDLFNQHGMDFVAQISLSRIPIVDEKMLILAIDRG